MTTRATLTITTPTRTITRYIHDGGAPRTMGPDLTALTARHSADTLADLLSAAPNWSYLDPTHGADRSHPGFGQAHCFPGWAPEAQDVVRFTAEGEACWTTEPHMLEWAYLIKVEGDATALSVYRVEAADAALQAPVSDLPSVDWDVVECGENFERCGHMVSVHADALGAPGVAYTLSVAQWFEWAPAPAERAAFIEVRDDEGTVKRYVPTGSRGSRARMGLYGSRHALASVGGGDHEPHDRDSVVVARPAGQPGAEPVMVVVRSFEADRMPAGVNPVFATRNSVRAGLVSA